MSFIKNIISDRDKTCSRCNSALGIRSHNSGERVGIDYGGKICHNCFDFIMGNIQEYDVMVKGGFDRPLKGMLEIHSYDNTNKIILILKSGQWFTLTPQMISQCDSIDIKERSLAKTIATVGISKESESRYLRIDFIKGNKSEFWILDIGNKVNNVRDMINTIVEREKKLDAQNLRFDNEYTQNDNRCSVCKKNGYGFDTQKERLCSYCFHQKYGDVILEVSNAEYYGGHKAYLAGGFFDKFELGYLYLTEKTMIFVKGEKNAEKRWQITIPLQSVFLSNWTIEEESRRKGVSGAGIGTAGIGFGGMLGAAFIHDEGKAHRLVIPYADENGIPQAPRFGISSFRGKTIREWAEKTYEQIVIAKKSIEEDQPNKKSESVTQDVDPLKILKIRYAKGEITKEEFEQMKSDLE